MATRKSLTEAQALYDSMTSKNPDREFRMLDISKEREVGKAIPAQNGWRVIRPGTWGVVVWAEEYDIREVRHCRDCGAEILTPDWLNDDIIWRCPDCEKKADERLERESLAWRREQDRQIRWAVANDEWEEPGRGDY